MRNGFSFRLLALIALLCALVATTPRPRTAQAAPEPARVPCCGPIAPAGERLASILDSMNVESLWLAHEHVNWETGEADRDADYEGPGNHSHCSAFVAAAAKRLGVYLLRPPEHGQVLLANAQADWLAGEAGARAGWRAISGMEEAQRLANRGTLVLVLYRNPDRHVPGHIAIVRPSEKSARALEENGPEIIQAGEHNHNKTNVRIGFENHPGAWPGGVLYYAHDLP
ncbi:MAG: hypothetical protein ABR924_02720 [Terracidiphilus sp.]|jgi:hypothetical protein